MQSKVDVLGTPPVMVAAANNFMHAGVYGDGWAGRQWP